MSKILFLWVFSLGECPQEILKQSFLHFIFTAGTLCDTGVAVEGEAGNGGIFLSNEIGEEDWRWEIRTGLTRVGHLI